MSSISILRKPNELLSRDHVLHEVLTNPQCLVLLDLILKRGPSTVDQILRDVSLGQEEVESLLEAATRAGLIEFSDGRFALSMRGEKRIAYGSLSLEFLVGASVVADSSVTPNALRNEYVIKELIGMGATSYTFLAEQSATHRVRTVKMFIPGTIAYEKLDEALGKRARISGDVAIPEIVDAGQVVIKFPDGRSLVTACVALRYVSDSQTFADFLKTKENVNPAVFERFVERVGGALAAIEAVGLHHGDLHERNILVTNATSPGVTQDFWVIDFIGVPSATSPEMDVPSDLENFRNHLLRAAVIACERYPGCSARFLLGESVFRVLEGLRNEAYKSFAELLEDFRRPPVLIPQDYFRAPLQEPFEWLRVEFIPSAEWLYRLFEPVPSRFDTIARFGNTWLSGPRGCGKSHYLRVLAFHPRVILEASKSEELRQKLESIKYDYKRAFGVLFACRLGEFKPFTPEVLGKTRFDPDTRGFLKHILILKIWNKSLQTVREGLEVRDDRTGRSVLAAPANFGVLIQFLEDRLGTMAVIGDSASTSGFLQCLAVCSARENSAVAVWPDAQLRNNIRRLTEADLDQFFEVLKRTFPDLSAARFYILVDDASYGHIHSEMQKILNSLVRAVQSNHCFKITCEKYMYTLDTADGRAIDPRHEVTYVDLGEVSTKAQRETAVDLSKYMARVIDSRLRAAGYKSNVKAILGESQEVREFLTALSIPGARRPKKGEKHQTRSRRPRAYYGGWNIIWSLAHGSVRTLLELVEHIFRTSNASQNTTEISLKSQDAAARSYSNRHYKALSMLPGAIGGEPIGPRLQGVISAIGEMSRQYLERYDTGEEGRWYETISLERLDRGRLPESAHEILDELVKYGLLLDEGITFSRAQFGLLQRYDMNKIFAPAFQTTYRVRNHIYVSRERFVELLSSPDKFVTRHRRKLDELTEHARTKDRNRPNQSFLFEDDSGSE
jgi:tRNA A-37 threonylcarbamoyl transferase component Bud32